MTPGWNPLRCGGTALPVPVLLMAKLVAVTFLLVNAARVTPAPLAAVLAVSGLLLILNRWPRASAFVMGAAMLAFQANSHLLAALLLLLTALYHPRTGPWLLRLLVAGAYVQAGFSNTVDPVWPNALLTLCQLGLAVVFLGLPRLWPAVIWASLLLQAFLFVDSSSFFAMQAAMLAFVVWPAELTVIFDGDCGICNRIRVRLTQIDFETAFTWRAFQTGVGDRFSIASTALEERLHLVAGGKISSGFRACKLILLYNPAFHLAVAVLLAAPGNSPWAPWWRRILTALLLAFFFPAFNAIGERAYDLVARNRHRLSSGGACAVEPGRLPH